MTNKEYWYWLCNIDNIGIRKITEILNFYGTPYHAFWESKKGLKEIKSLSDSDRENIQNSKNIEKIKKSYNKLFRGGVSLITMDDTDYPEKLRHIYNPPYVLYVKGNLPKKDKISIAIVGARNCSDYGKEVTKYFAGILSGMGVQIISGLARGIDGYSHLGALESKGSTFGILGSGIDICYPKESFSLYMKMQEDGGVISEYGMGVSAKPFRFPMRNRIISGLSDGILVVEAKEKSGSLITVDIGLEEGKNIYAVPGSIGSSLSSGCHNLIKMGAKLVTSPQDILEDFSIYYEKNEKSIIKSDKLLEPKEKMVYACLSHLPKHMNEIAEKTNINIEELSEILLQLELKQLIKENRKNYYSCFLKNI